jgi:voltage-gated potassium channel
MALVVTGVAVAVVLLGGSGAWLAEHRMPRSTIRSWGDGLWWALTTLTTVGYGDHVPVTLAGRIIAAAVMITGVAVLGGVAAGIALVVARAVAATEEQALEVEAKSIEQRLESRLDNLDERLARIEEQLQRFASRTTEVEPARASRLLQGRRECAVAPEADQGSCR